MNEELSKLIIKAQGNRSQNAFAGHCGINSASLTRIVKGEYTPSPKTLKKIADKAHNGVTYEDLMHAAGYLEREETTKEDKFSNIPLEVQEHLSAFNDLEDFTSEDWEEIKKFIAFIKSKKD